MPRPNRDDAITQALRRNPNPVEVAIELDLHVSTVYRSMDRTGIDLELIRKVNGLPTYRKRLTLQYLVQKGVPQNELARRLGVTPQYINQLAA